MALTTVPASLSATALTLTTAAQPNITSVGTLTGLTVSGNIAGTLTTAAQTNITSVGTLSSLTVSGALNGTLSTAAQTNITSVGTLTGLVVNGNASIQTGALTLSGANPALVLSNSGDAKVNFVRSSNTITYSMSTAASGGHGFYDNAASAYDLYMKAGNVAMGTSTVLDGLNIYASSNTNLRLHNGTTGASTSAGGIIQQAGNEMYVWNYEPSNLIFGSNNSERMRIDSSGRIGIGAAPGNNWRNDLTDKVLMLGTEATLHSDAGVTTELWNNAYVNNSDTFVNISTRGASRYMQYSGYHKWFTAASASGGSTISTEINSTPKMMLDISGNLGIGTSAPLGKLHIRHDMFTGNNVTELESSKTVYGGLTFEGVANTGAGSTATTQQGITWRVNNYNGSTDYGNQAQLVVGNNGDVGTFMGFFTSDNYSSFPRERMRIDSSGNVGIGTSNPTEALEVAGSVKLTGSSRILLPNFWIGPVPNTANNNSGAVLLVNLSTINASNVGFQFSGSIIGNSYTGQAFVNVNIVKHYSNDNIAFKANASDEILTSTVTRMQLNLCTVTYSGSSYLAIVKNGGGTGTIQLNGYFQGWYPSQVTEVASGTYTITTNHGNLNF